MTRLQYNLSAPGRSVLSPTDNTKVNIPSNTHKWVHTSSCIVSVSLPVRTASTVPCGKNTETRQGQAGEATALLGVRVGTETAGAAAPRRPHYSRHPCAQIDLKKNLPNQKQYFPVRNRLIKMRTPKMRGQSIVTVGFK